MDLRRTWQRLPRGVKLGLGLVALTGAVAAAFKVQKVVRAAGLEVDRRVLDGLKLGPARVDTVLHLVDEWKRDGRLTADEMAALLAAAYQEGGFNMRARSPDSAPDAKGGHAWGTFQFLMKTLGGLGVDVAEITPVKVNGEVSPAELERAARGSARAAVKFCYYGNWLPKARARLGNDSFRLARELFTIWNAGHSITWDFIAQRAPSKKVGSWGYVHYTVAHKLDVLNTFRSALGLEPVAITKTV